MANKTIRPDKKSAKQSIRSMTALSAFLEDILTEEAAVRQTTQHSAGTLRQDAAAKELALLDIETLNANKDGIRISALRNAGIDNVAQIINMPIARITGINGIGEQTAKKIKSIVDEMYRTVITTAKIRIDIKVRSSNQDDLIKNLYVLRHYTPFRAKAEELLAGAPKLKDALNEAAPASGSLKWAFSSQGKKEAAFSACEYLTALERGSFGTEGSRLEDEFSRKVKLAIKSATPAAAYSDFEQNSVAYYTLLESLGLSTAEAVQTGLPAELVAEIEQYPIDLSHMKTELRRYQLFGAKYVLRQGKTLLGDEMGLGKTIQALAVFSDLKAKGETHFLVVCPASVLVNWQRETEKHTDLPSIIIHGWDKTLELEQWRVQGGVGITNFESIKGFVDIMDFTFGAMVVDEAHFVKNPHAQRTKALITASEFTGRILYMTGTPLENRVDEMCFLIGCLRSDIAAKVSEMKTLSTTDKFKAELAPVYLRRIRNDVLTELPDLIESEDWLEPTKAELKAYYNAVQSGNFMAMRRVSWDVNVGGETQDNTGSESGDRSGETGMTDGKTVGEIDIGKRTEIGKENATKTEIETNVKTITSSKANRLLEICDEARDEGSKVLVFSFFIDTLQKICTMLGNRALGPITGSMPVPARQELIDRFTESESGKVLVAQVQAGGVGLNIQSANVVIFAEPQIKPSMESQAISRAYRMGQVRDVQVHRLLCVNTIDERIMKILSSKQAEFDAYAEESVVGTESLKSQTESAWIKEMIEAERARISELS